MITVRKSEDRGVGRHGWLTSYHTFSFANYYDARHMGFRDLRVINEDTVIAGRGFGDHRHDNMEIISIVMDGALAHRDSSGGDGVLRRGEVQRMSAGTGVVHSEFNASETEPVHFFQIWILPATENIPPGYEQKSFPYEERRNQLRLVVTPDGADGALTINQDARLYVSILDSGASVDYTPPPGRGGWVQVATGEVELNGTPLRRGDGAAIEGERALLLRASGSDPAELLLFDLP
ncbi:MAG TPA: pirin family protein [Thermoanaerobaculia bacterium]|nr:pirin family protein [Thermoanaerobaculia bacterium]